LDKTTLAYAQAAHAQAQRQAPAEKKEVTGRQAAIAKRMQAQGSRRVDGIGQKIGGIDPRLYFRWHQEKPGCWRDKNFVAEFLRDNPQCRAPGYKAGTPGRPTSRWVGPGQWEKLS
jgi:hypothetical protein